MRGLSHWMDLQKTPLLSVRRISTAPRSTSDSMHVSVAFTLIIMGYGISLKWNTSCARCCELFEWELVGWELFG